MRLLRSLFTVPTCLALMAAGGQGEQELRAAAKLDPSNARTLYYLGRLLYTSNLFGEAIGKSAEAHFRLGSVLEHEGDLNGALAQYKEATASDPKLASACYRAGRIYQRLGKAKDSKLSA